MKELLSSITSKGQITIPLEVRRRLGVMPHDKVAFILGTDSIQVVARKGTVIERTAGIIKVPGPPLSAEELREAAARAIAEDGIRRVEG